jgi:hypothetical protein
MKAIQITPYEKVLVDVYRLATQLKVFQIQFIELGFI